MKNKYLRKIFILYFLLFLAVITGCAVALLGVGAGFGALVYINGKLIRTYDSEYHKTILASRETLEDLIIPISEEIADELNAIIRAKRPDGTSILIEIERVEQNLTKVSVRTGAVGVWDKNVSAQIHDLINNKLAQSTNQNSKYSTQSSKKDSSLKIKKQGDIQYQKKKDNIVIYFNQNSNDLSDEANKRLDQVAKILIENPNYQILISGFSNSSGSLAYSKMISGSRASAVKVYLIGKGVKPSQITIEAHGAQNLIGNNEIEEEKKLNRRVEIEFSGVKSK